jgi:hypothetical protein
MKRSFIYVLVIFTAIGLVLGKYFIQKDLENVPMDISELDNTKHIEELEGEKEITGVDSVNSTFTITNKENDTYKTEYNYVLKINEISGTYKIKKNKEESYLIFDASGTAKFTLTANDVLIIYDIPVNSTYRLEQSTNKKYKTKIGDEVTNISEGTTFVDTNIVFNNINVSSKQYTPDTKDEIKIILGILALSIATLFALSKLKITKFTTE